MELKLTQTNRKAFNYRLRARKIGLNEKQRIDQRTTRATQLRLGSQVRRLKRKIEEEKYDKS